jgi:hypothetical protein
MNSPACLARALALAAVVVGLAPAPAEALVIPAGSDFLRSIAGGDAGTADPGDDTGTFLDLSLPADLFGPGSDPLVARLYLRGVPIGPFPVPPGPHFKPGGGPPFVEREPSVQHVVQQTQGRPATDTIVQRLSQATLPSIGSQDQIPIEIVALSLVSIQPIQVTFNGGQVSSFFDVFVDLQPTQQLGLMQIERTGQRSGVFQSELPVNAQLTFHVPGGGPVGPPIPVPGKTLITTQPVPWTIPVPGMVAPFAAALLMLGAYRRRS